MSVRRVGNRWQVRLRVGGGARVERTLPPGAKRADAQALESTIRRAQIDAACGRAPRYLIDAALDRWVDTSAKHLKSWERDLKYRIGVLREYTKGRSLDALPEVADRIKTSQSKEGLAAPSINRYVALLRRVGNLAERWGWTDKPLGRRVQLLPENSKREVYLSPDEVMKIVGKLDPIVADMLKFSALTGLRRGELLPLRPEQVAEGILILTSATKSGRPRAIPLPKEAERIAQKRLPWKITMHQLRYRFEAARKAANMAHVHWHDLRHTYASWIAKGSGQMTALRDLLGHSSLSVTSKYSHLAPSHLREAVNTLPILDIHTVRKVGKKFHVKRVKKAA